MATTAQEGSVFHAGVLEASENASSATGRWMAAINAACASDRSAAKASRALPGSIENSVADPLPAEVALAVLDVLEQEKLKGRAIEMGEILGAGLELLRGKYEIIGDVRGFGLLQGVELVKDRETREPDVETGRAITRRCMELGLSMNIVAVGTMAAVWRIAPPLTVTREEIERGIAIMDQAIGDIIKGATSVAAE